MNKDFGTGKWGKHAPYRVEEGFFGELEGHVAAELGIAGAKPVQQEEATFAGAPKKRGIGFRVACVSVSVAAVCLAMFFVLRPGKPSAVDMQMVEQAYANLSPTDQDFLMEVYQDDVFLREQ